MFSFRACAPSLFAYLAATLLVLAAPADHLIGGIPRAAEDVQVIERIGYLAGYSAQARNPAWVAYRLRGTPASAVSATITQCEIVVFGAIPVAVAFDEEFIA